MQFSFDMIDCGILDFYFVLIMKRLDMLHTGYSSLLVAIYWFPSSNHGFLSTMLRICLLAFKKEKEKKRDKMRKIKFKKRK